MGESKELTRIDELLAQAYMQLVFEYPDFAKEFNLDIKDIEDQYEAYDKIFNPGMDAKKVGLNSNILLLVGYIRALTEVATTA